MGGTDKKGMENQKVRSIAEQLSRVQGELTDATANAEKAVRQLRWVWEGDDASTFFNAWPTTRHSLDLSTGGVDELAKKLRDEIGEQELASGVTGPGGGGDGDGGGDSDGDGTPDADDKDDDNDGTPDDKDKDKDDDNDKVPDDRDDDPEDDDDQDDDGVDDEDEDGQHRDGEGVWDKGGFDKPELNVGMTVADGEKQLWDKEFIGGTWGDEDGNHLSGELLGTEGKADYEVGISKEGLVASGGVMAGAYVAKVSGSYSNSHGTQVEGTAYAGAEANADAGVKLGLDGAKANVGGEVFVGGKGEASVSQDLGPVDVGVGGEISYGIGAHAEADAEISSDNIGVSVDVGATLGIGGGIKFDIGFDPPW
ncbi:hypothetical protein [Pedococcus bigeumensis]|uniref:WXG100 family type VII secretion target n=1 Tax=Pedococcus bigeumensis TaxID=433644 RepID=A0A502CZ37_9MICO|nr:hypothetical protein [Pedococcus bigeumensis]TPG17086.1 hypothetical protein EAH86_09940 [Pedococcus bigeumensis]